MSKLFQVTNTQKYELKYHQLSITGRKSNHQERLRKFEEKIGE